MKRWVVCALMACVCLPAAQAAPAKPIKLERMEYSKARQIILGYGWKPVRGDCTGGNGSPWGEACARFPEIDNCMGTGQCDMVFSKPGQCLIVFTAGEYGTTDSVIFRHTACGVPQRP